MFTQTLVEEVSSVAASYLAALRQLEALKYAVPPRCSPLVESLRQFIQQLDHICGLSAETDASNWRTTITIELSRDLELRIGARIANALLSKFQSVCLKGRIKFTVSFDQARMKLTDIEGVYVILTRVKSESISRLQEAAIWQDADGVMAFNACVTNSLKAGCEQNGRCIYIEARLDDFKAASEPIVTSEHCYAFRRKWIAQPINKEVRKCGSELQLCSWLGLLLAFAGGTNRFQ